MRIGNMMALGALALGMAAAGGAAEGQWKLGLGAATSAANMDNYHAGLGATGQLGRNEVLGFTESSTHIRARFINYLSESELNLDDQQEAGVDFATLIGPNFRFISPKAGGHVGYTRFDNLNFLEVGPDVSADIRIGPNLDLQAVVTPTWLINEDDADYQTKASLGMVWTFYPDA